ncbi:MAG: DUF4783 domain-containing protein [Bacteroidales bacterium]|nr:DUF4783 domain-containing protein [Bacteroidales bacterium]
MFIRTFIIIVSVWFFTPCIAQTEDLSGDILKALSKGNASLLAAGFNATIGLEMPGNEGTFSKSQAEGIMGDFFRKNPPLSAEFIHEGSSEGGSQYLIGNYISSGQKFRFYILLKNISGKHLIHQIQFEKD